MPFELKPGFPTPRKWWNIWFIPVTNVSSRNGIQLIQTLCILDVKAVQPERITIEVPEAPDEVPSVGTVAVTQGCTQKGLTVLGSMMELQRSFRQRSLHAIWVSLRSVKKKEVPERRTEPIGRSGRN
ncbi:hypothetical protein GGU10DRAFT_380745 [Lentinula aff. detonsa]|uniref:Uncharacterized protein n=1 Tax=Lentinula aff. detonsa TaxID=2804958 RepID=A0AA38NB88_9AGAR|nr:hypothetical protein GGU10DRAFT_380745 [Lentinula aff. detonsa]